MIDARSARPNAVAVLIASTLVLAPAGVVRAAVVWEGGFETGDTSEYDFLLNPEVDGQQYLTVMSDEVADGDFAARVELHNDAVWSNGLKRVELQHRPDDAATAEGTELFFAWSFFLPEMLPVDPAQTIGYWESANSFSQTMAFVVEDH